MKVLMICTVPLAGNGIATCVMNYASALASQTSMHVLAPEGVPEDIQQKLNTLGIGLHQLPNRKTGMVQYFLALWKHLRKFRYDIVHIHGNSCTVSIELLAAVLAGCPVRIAHSHTTYCEHIKAHRLLRPVFELCVNGRIACGQEAGYWLFHKKDFWVLNNGIQLDSYAYDQQKRLALRQELGIDDNTLLLGHVGLFIPVKNHAFLLKIAQTLVDRGVQNWKLLLVGDGDLMEQTQQMVRELSLMDKIIFVGSVPSTAGYLQAMDLFLMPSIHEGLPFVLVEAQAAGLQALVSDQVPDEANLTGNLRFLPINNVNLWVDTLLQHQEHNRQHRSAEACETLQKTGYSIADNAESLLHEYTRLLKKHR